MRGKRPGQQPFHTALAKDAKAARNDSYGSYDSYYGQQGGYSEKYAACYSGGYSERHAAAGGGSYAEGYAQALAEVKKAVMQDMTGGAGYSGSGYGGGYNEGYGIQMPWE